MRTLASPLRLLGQTLVGLLALQRSGSANVQAAVVEVDLVFPRNDTYRPGRIPIIFAVQNSALAVPLAIDIGWTISDFDRKRGMSGSRRLLCDELGESDPFFTNEWLNYEETTNGEATWILVWTIHSQNCSETGNGRKLSQLVQNRHIIFTTRQGAQEPDVLQGTDACSSSPGVTFNVTDTFLSGWASSNQGRDSCNVLAPGPPPAANICAIAIGPAVAAAANKTTPYSYCRTVGRSETSTTTTPDNAAVRGAPLWAADAGFTYLIFLLSVIGVIEIL